MNNYELSTIFKQNVVKIFLKKLYKPFMYRKQAHIIMKNSEDCHMDIVIIINNILTVIFHSY